MKGNRNLGKVQLFIILILLEFTVGIHPFKLPINLRRTLISSQPEPERRLQLEMGQDDDLSDAIYGQPVESEKVLLFPKNEDENESVEYQVRLSFDNQSETPSTEQLKGLERFYKYELKSQPAGEEVIVFPKDPTGNVNDQKAAESRGKIIDDLSVDSGSEGKSSVSDNIEAGIALAEPDKHTKNTTNNFSETLAYIVRQLLFRMSVTETRPQIENTEMTTISYESSPESVVDVQEQSLYSGPKIRSQNSDCPEGLKRNRNGSCQKPSRRLITS